MSTKLKIKIQMNDIFYKKLNTNIPLNFYYLRLYIIDVDKRFLKTDNRKINCFKSTKYNMNLIYNPLISKGYIRNSNSMDNIFCFPNVFNFNMPIIYCFNTDKERMKYLKMLYFVFREWSNFYFEFLEDNMSIMKINDNIWEIFNKDDKNLPMYHSQLDIYHNENYYYDC
jgi:hypothetical protein